MHTAAVSPAIRILVGSGLANLFLSFVLGFVLSGKRMREPIAKHHWLLTAHVVSLQEGLMLLGLGFAAQFMALPQPWLLVGAWLVAIASVFQDLSGIVNWLQRTDDQFAQRSSGWKLATVNAILNFAGLAILCAGFVRWALA